MPFNSTPHLFPGDEFLRRPDNEDSVCASQSFDTFIKSDNFGTSDRRLHINLLPIPYVGNLEKATIYILMSNPGLSNGDYYAEDRSPDFKNALVRNIRQEFETTDFPFLFLNPRFAWHPGFGYWHGKLKGFAKVIREECGLTYQEALEYLAKQIACLELVLYHSEKFPEGDLVNELLSVECVVDYVHKVLVRKAERGQALLIVARGNDFWELKENRNIIVYKRFETRAAHITPKTKRVGRPIALRLNLKSIP